MSSSFTALYIDTLIPPTDLKMKRSAMSVAEIQSVTVFQLSTFSVWTPILLFIIQEPPCMGKTINYLEDLVQLTANLRLLKKV